VQQPLEGGFDRTYISLIERGINSSTICIVVGLAAVLNVAPSKIMRPLGRAVGRQCPIGERK
jgi:hypothetical protein